MSKYAIQDAAAATELKGFLDELKLGFLTQEAKTPMEKPKIVQTGDVLSKVAVYMLTGKRVPARLEGIIAVAKKNI